MLFWSCEIVSLPAGLHCFSNAVCHVHVLIPPPHCVLFHPPVLLCSKSCSSCAGNLARSSEEYTGMELDDDDKEEDSRGGVDDGALVDPPPMVAPSDQDPTPIDIY